MNVQRWLQVDLAVLTVLGTALLGAGQQNLSLTLLMLFAAPAAVVFTDIYQLFRLNRPLANLAAVGAVGYAVFQFTTTGMDNQLLSVANLLVYLQLILLLQEKSHRLNWQLLVLSLLEVVVAAAMQLNFRYFVLLLAYLACALIAMGLLFLLRETGRVDESARARRRSHSSGTFAASVLPRTTPMLRWVLGGTPRATVVQPSAVLTKELVRCGYLYQLVWFGGATLVFALVMFYTTPRIGGTQWQGGRYRQATVGFSRQISLDEMGDILQSDEMALRISFFDEQTGEPLRLAGEPYLRGAVLTRYGDNQKQGRWTVMRESRRTVPLPEAQTTEGLVRQEVWLEPSNESIVFGAYPIVRLPGTEPPLRYDRAAGMVTREGRQSWIQPSRFRYVVGSLAFRDSWQVTVVPWERPSEGAEGYETALEELQECLRFNPYSFPRIKALADQILQEAEATDADALRKARILEQHFLQPGRYQYSLRFRQARNQEMDPIEDFVTNHRTGHCEYFATALVLMLRSQKIPARLVVGYHGGEFNSLGSYYLVRQRDAHAWVEALLNPDDVKKVGRPSLPIGGAEQGGWLRLDPTPGGGGPSDDSSSLVWNRFDDLMEYAEFLWSDYVVGLNPERQRQSLYVPVWDRMSDTLSRNLDPRRWKLKLLANSKWARWLGLVDEEGHWEWRWVAAAAALLVLVALLSRSILAVALRSLSQAGRRWTAILRQVFRRETSGRLAQVEFYARFERLLARRGWRRDAGQTPSEFVRQIATRGGAGGRAAWAADALWIVEQFYRVRFGGATLDKAETAAIEHALRIVDAGLEGRPLPAAKPS